MIMPQLKVLPKRMSSIAVTQPNSETATMLQASTTERNITTKRNAYEPCPIAQVVELSCNHNAMLLTRRLQETATRLQLRIDERNHSLRMATCIL
jgi:hypothetical protein